MTEMLRFDTVEGYEVAIDLDQVASVWQGKSPGCIVFVLFGSENPIEVVGNFNEFLSNFVTHYDCRRKPRRIRTTRQSVKKKKKNAS